MGSSVNNNNTVIGQLATNNNNNTNWVNCPSGATTTGSVTTPIITGHWVRSNQLSTTQLICPPINQQYCPPPIVRWVRSCRPGWLGQQLSLSGLGWLTGSLPSTSSTGLSGLGQLGLGLGLGFSVIGSGLGQPTGPGPGVRPGPSTGCRPSGLGQSGSVIVIGCQ